MNANQPLRSEKSSPAARPGLTRVDAAMVSGLPSPDSDAARAWLENALANLQKQDPRPDIDLGGIEERLRQLEARPVAGADPWDAIAALTKRVSSLEAELAAALARVPEPAPVLNLDPLDPANWRDVPTAQAALLVMVTEEAAKRCGQSVTLYEEMVRLDALGASRTADEDLRLMQHQGWAKERAAVELARLAHNGRISRLESVEDAVAYPWRDNWPILK